MITFSSLTADYDFMDKARRYHPELSPNLTYRELREYLESVYGCHIDQSNDTWFEMTLVFDDPEKELIFRLKYL